MCDPVTLLGASLALSATQAVVGFAGARSSFGAQMDAYQQNAENAAAATANSYKNINIRTQQEGQAHAQAAQQSKVDVAQAAASAEVAAAEGGVGGLALEGILRDVYASAGRNEATADANLRMSRDYMAGELDSAEAQGQSQVNGMAIPEKPSATSFLINGFASGLNSYSSYLGRKES